MDLRDPPLSVSVLGILGYHKSALKIEMFVKIPKSSTLRTGLSVDIASSPANIPVGWTTNPVWLRLRHFLRHGAFSSKIRTVLGKPEWVGHPTKPPAPGSRWLLFRSPHRGVFSWNVWIQLECIASCSKTDNCYSPKIRGGKLEPLLLPSIDKVSSGAINAI